MRTSRTRAGRRAALILTLGLAAAAGSATPGPALAKTLPTRAAAVSWGQNSFGELGNGTTTGAALYGGVSELGSGVAQVAAGSTHAVALKTDGTVWAWGDNSIGELGTGAFANQSTPIQVPGLTGVTQVAAGLTSSMALRSDGTVWQWGLIFDGPDCNYPTFWFSSTPVQTGLTDVTQIAAGAYFELALRSDGTVWALGCNNDGALGIGDAYYAPAWTKVPGLSNVIAISAGFDSGVALERRSPLTTLTAVLAWGEDAILDGDPRTPVQVDGIGAPQVAAVSAGRRYMLAVGTDGSVWSWGLDFADDTGVAQSSARPAELFGPGSGITQVSAGDDHALALRSDGTVLAWGDNPYGELGDGTIGGDSTPVQVSGLANATQVSAGNGVSLAIHQVVRLPLALG